MISFVPKLFALILAAENDNLGKLNVFAFDSETIRFADF